MVDKTKVVFIMGPGHCGSTLLDLILGSHSSGFSMAEFHVITRFIDDRTLNPESICSVCEGPCQYWNSNTLDALSRLYSSKSITDKILRETSRLFRNPYAPLFARTGQSMLIDSSKSASWYRRQTRYPWWNVTPYLIYLGRDGRAVTNSYRRKYPEQEMTKVATDWARRIQQMNAYYLGFSHPKARVSYEQLTENPGDTVEQLCSFLNIGYEPGMLAYWTHEHHAISGNAGTTSLVLRQREALGTSEDFRQLINQGGQYYDDAYYERLGLAIKPDNRWEQELSEQDRQTFDQIAGHLNEPFATQTN